MVQGLLIPFRYKYVDQITWVKVNQINATIATGRTGHWLNHCKETCLVGIKGSPKANFMLDKNSIVEEVRGTSQKPDAVCFFPPTPPPPTNFANRSTASSSG